MSKLIDRNYIHMLLAIFKEIVPTKSNQFEKFMYVHISDTSEMMNYSAPTGEKITCQADDQIGW